jgi:hypothetical protein
LRPTPAQDGARLLLVIGFVLVDVEVEVEVDGELEVDVDVEDGDGSCQRVLITEGHARERRMRARKMTAAMHAAAVLDAYRHGVAG